MEYLPQELELYYIVPALRREFALQMRQKGMKSVDIAKVLGITKSAVSQYFSKARAKEFVFNPPTKKEIQESVKTLMKGGSALEEMERIIHILKQNSMMCKFHRSKEHIAANCDICFRYAK